MAAAAGSTLARQADIVISGCGVAGSALAALLGCSPLLKGSSVLMLDRRLPEVKRGSLDGKYQRVYALNPAAVGVLRKSGAWEVVEEEYRHWPARFMHTLDSRAKLGSTTFTSTNEEPLSHFLESEVIISSLMTQIKGHSNITLQQASIQSIHKPENDDFISLTLQDGSTVDTGLLISAEGFSSNIRQLAKIPWTEYMYSHKALVGTLKMESSANDAAWQRFHDFGPTALLPLGPETSSLVLFTGENHIAEMMQMDESQIVDVLNGYWTSQVESNPILEALDETFSQLVKACLPSSSSSRSTPLTPPRILGVDKSTLASYPVGFGHASHYVKPNLALVGDSAHRIHPLAGQGANLGFSDCIILLDKLEKCAAIGEKPGKYEYLLQYEREAQAHNLPTQLFCDAIYRIYGNSSLPVVALRNLASRIANDISQINSAFVKHATFSK